MIKHVVNKPCREAASLRLTRGIGAGWWSQFLLQASVWAATVVHGAIPPIPPQLQTLPELGGVAMELEAPLGSAATSGYVPVKLNFRNKSGRPKRVEMEFNSSSQFMHHNSRQRGISQKFVWEVPPGSSVPTDAVKILLPSGVLDDSPFWGRWRVDTRVGGEFTSGNSISAFVNPGGVLTPPVAFSESVRVDLGALAADFSGGSGAHPGSIHPDPREKRFDAPMGITPRGLRSAQTNLQSIPADPRSFAGVAGFWIAEKEWKQISQTMQEALLEWVRGGGSLYVTRPEKPGQSAEPLLGLDPQQNDVSRSWGLGMITRQSGWDANNIARIKNDVTRLDASPFPSAEIDYSHWSSELVAPPRLKIGLLVAFLFGFGILAAPVNLYWIAPKQKRHRLFVSVPLLSMGASGALFGFIIFTDGVGGSGIRNGMLLLEPGAGSSVWYQEQISRTGLSSESAFPVPEDVNFLLVKVPNAIRHGSALLREASTAAGGWFVSRAVQAHLLTRFVPSRAEVVLREDSGKAPSLLSSVSHPMGPVFYMDQSRQFWKTAQISPGAPVVLEQSNQTEFEKWYGAIFTEPSSNLKARAKHVAARPGWFYAQAAKAPEFWIPTSPQIRWERDEMLCCGPVKAPVLNAISEVRP